jgi:hypothetical protein
MAVVSVGDKNIGDATHVNLFSVVVLLVLLAVDVQEKRQPNDADYNTCNNEITNGFNLYSSSDK